MVYIFFDGFFTNAVPVDLHNEFPGQRFMTYPSTVSLSVQAGSDLAAEMKSKWDRDQGRFIIFTHEPIDLGGQPRSFTTMMINLAHQMVHAWMDIFAYDDDAARRTEQVSFAPPRYEAEHGTAFGELTRFITRTLRDNSRSGVSEFDRPAQLAHGLLCRIRKLFKK
ncbi:hypothetical protein BKA67DRAFT_688000 [Truncatella angustata]|uniref:Uncharacterized protein n=1 Tax=Truncatella angustata TaxID=152316 RepID=A0A9P8UQU7_9PEZI|nr:uncharacterized protein BKA67DRAFT_688000 [Truncatella angustata]KAH6656573.1 hypothetical protein BKA67DRAFT_688000 [Truncatella angustata]KAH8196544.1 hypothetical protein TruAng_009306 [Truncatella angustata]